MRTFPLYLSSLDLLNSYSALQEVTVASKLRNSNLKMFVLEFIVFYLYSKFNFKMFVLSFFIFILNLISKCLS